MRFLHEGGAMKALRKITSKITLFLLFVFFSSYSIADAKRVSIMSYNVENLFDAVHDEGKDDWTYLPLFMKDKGSEAYDACMSNSNYYYRNLCLKLDWTHETFWIKLVNIAKMIRSYNDYKGPDIIALQEVENIYVLRAMVEYELAGMGYDADNILLVEGPDVRGIDVAIITRFPVADYIRYHEVDLNGLNEDGIYDPDLDRDQIQKVRPTRGILEVPLRIEDKIVRFFVNHWPSQGNSKETLKRRKKAARVLMERIDELPKSTLSVALGDFNTVKKENKAVFEDILMKGASDGKAYFRDIYEECIIAKGYYCTPTPDDHKSSLTAVIPEGSYYYKGGKRWNRLDKIFFSDSVFKDKNIKADVRNFAVYTPMYTYPDNPEFNVRSLNDKGFPNRFEYNKKTKKWTGFSDHLPVVMEFDIKN